MEVSKIATIVVDVFLGFIVVLLGLEMLPKPLKLFWVLFNVWLWIVLPTTMLWANKKENDNRG